MLLIFSTRNLSEQVQNRPLPSLWPAPNGEEGSAVRMYLMEKKHHPKTQRSLLQKVEAEEENPNLSLVISTSFEPNIYCHLHFGWYRRDIFL